MTAIPSIFLSYASQDREAARSLRDALSGQGLTVWYDENELGGGDAWDQKIRRQIRECDFFMPVISAQTEARHEGYFRREWRLAVERTLDMADDVAFLLPVVIDATPQATARVPEKFLSVQWLSVPAGRPNPGLKALGERLLAGSTVVPARAAAPARAQAPGAKASKPARPLPEFPREEPGQRLRFLFHVVGWLAQSIGILIQRLPRILRWLVYLWLCGTILPWFCSKDETNSPKKWSATVSTDPVAQAADKYRESKSQADATKLREKIVEKLGTEIFGVPEGATDLLAVPFADTSADPSRTKLADSVFALLYGQLSVAHPAQVAVSPTHLGPSDGKAARQLATKRAASYVLYGGLTADGQSLTITLDKADDGSTVITKTYPVVSADPNAIASEINAAVPALEAK